MLLLLVLYKLFFSQPPSPVQPWTVPLDCTKEPPKSFSYTDFSSDVITGSEDCLYVNLSTSCMKPKKPLPVMFWIESFSYSFSLDINLDPSLLLKEDVIFVKCGFRLGPFGFLSVNDVAAPGNAGLKDIVMALKWVKQNISLFGGDPNNVTLFGTGCGGSIVHCMMLSSMASGLFHKAIAQSLCTLNRWMFIKNPFQAVLTLAKELGLETQCKFEIVDILKAMPAEEIQAACARIITRTYKTEVHHFDDVFKPCIEEEFEGQPAFLTKSPFLILKSGKFNKVPLIIGSNNTEAILPKCLKEDFYENHARLIVPKCLAGEDNVNNNIGQEIINFYSGDDVAVHPDIKNQHLQLISDYYYLYYMNKSVRMHSHFSSESPVYYYILNYAGSWRDVPKPLDYFNSMGHCSELPCIFRIKPPNSPLCRGFRDSLKVRQRVVRLWTNFAKCG